MPTAPRKNEPPWELKICAPSPPPPPDFAGAAVAQGAANKDAAIAGAQLSNPNVSNAYGSRTVSYRTDPVTGNPVPYIADTFSPGQQQLFNTGQATSQAMGDLGLQGARMASGILGQQFNISGSPTAMRDIGGQPQARDAVRDAMLARVTQQNTRDRESVNSDLVARGIPQGSRAYTEEMSRLDRSLTDARQQAEIAAGAEARADYGQQMQRAQQEFGAGLDTRRQGITEALANRQTPIQEINALRTGAQIAPLQFQPYSGQNVAPAPLMGAATASGNYGMQQYQADISAQNGMMSGLGMLGGGIMGATNPWWLPKK